jgi:hypothetical protein
MKHSASSLKTWQLCNKKYYWKYKAGLVDKEVTSELAFGSVFHLALESWWVDQDLDRAIDVIIKNHDGLGPTLRHTAQVLMHGYHAAYEGQNFKTIKVEDEFEYVALQLDPQSPIARSAEFHGRVDALAMDANGDLVLVEHKTTRSDIVAGSRYWDRVHFADTQIDLYSLAYPDAKYILYDVIKVPSNRKKRTENMEAYHDRILEAVSSDLGRFFRREKFYRDKEHLDEHRADVLQLADQINQAERTDAYPKNPNSCYAFNRECEYMPLCKGELDPEPGELYKIRSKK